MNSALQSPTWTQRVIALLVGAAMLGFVAWVDTLTGPNIHIGVVYWVPVGLAAWYGGRPPAYLLTILAIALWYRFSVPPSDHHLPLNLQAWNIFIRLFYYPAVAETALYLRNTERRLQRLVEHRTAELRLEIVERERAQAGQSKLAAQLSDAEDAERRRLAYDIHDALSQMLGVIKLNLETAVAESPTDSRQYERLSDVVNVVNDLIRQTQELTFDLHPAMLEDLGLVPTLRQFADEFHRRTLAEVIVSEAGGPVKLASPLASYLFRSIKELVSNSVRHGNAREILVAVHWLDAGVRIVVDDDGGGFDTRATVGANGRRGLGLAGISERLSSLGGMLRLESQPGQGARVIMEAPLPAPVGTNASPAAVQQPANQAVTSVAG
jgi:signal transduction histidine kinase